MSEDAASTHREKSDPGFIAPALIRVLWLLDRLSIANLVGHLLPISRTTLVDAYVVIWLFVLCVSLFALPSCGLLAALALYRVVDILVINLRIILVDRKNSGWEPASPERTVSLLLINLCEFALAFAVLYLAWGSVNAASGGEFGPLAALYYSFTTLSTLGYGDFAPADARTQCIVIGQILTSVTFLVAILPTLIGAVQNPPGDVGRDR